MPSTSKAQQAAAGIAHAAKKGEIPVSKLRGASKQMFRSMDDTSLKHFAKTKRTGLPQYAHEGVPIPARVLFAEGRDDLATGKVNVPAETKSYARMNKSDVMDQPGGTAKKWFKSLNLRKALTNQKNVKGFPSMDKGEQVHVKEARSPDDVVAELLEDIKGSRSACSPRRPASR